jgi:hypothetical protein
MLPVCYDCRLAEVGPTVVPVRVLLACTNKHERSCNQTAFFKSKNNSFYFRAYQAIKCLVTASKCPAVKDHLVLEPTRWQVGHQQL